MDFWGASDIEPMMIFKCIFKTLQLNYFLSPLSCFIAEALVCETWNKTVFYPVCFSPHILCKPPSKFSSPSMSWSIWEPVCFLILLSRYSPNPSKCIFSYMNSLLKIHSVEGSAKMLSEWVIQLVPHQKNGGLGDEGANVSGTWLH